MGCGDLSVITLWRGIGVLHPLQWIIQKRVRDLRRADGSKAVAKRAEIPFELQPQYP